MINYALKIRIRLISLIAWILVLYSILQTEIKQILNIDNIQFRKYIPFPPALFNVNYYATEGVPERAPLRSSPPPFLSRNLYIHRPSLVIV